MHALPRGPRTHRTTLAGGRRERSRSKCVPPSARTSLGGSARQERPRGVAKIYLGGSTRAVAQGVLRDKGSREAATVIDRVQSDPDQGGQTERHPPAGESEL